GGSIGARWGGGVAMGGKPPPRPASSRPPATRPLKAAKRPGPLNGRSPILRVPVRDGPSETERRIGPAEDRHARRTTRWFCVGPELAAGDSIYAGIRRQLERGLSDAERSPGLRSAHVGGWRVIDPPYRAAHPAETPGAAMHTRTSLSSFSDPPYASRVPRSVRLGVPTHKSRAMERLRGCAKCRKHPPAVQGLPDAWGCLL